MIDCTRLRDTILRIVKRGPCDTAEIRTELGAETWTEGNRVMAQLSRLVKTGALAAVDKCTGGKHGGRVYRVTGQAPRTIPSPRALALVPLIVVRGVATAADLESFVGGARNGNGNGIGARLAALERAGIVEKCGMRLRGTEKYARAWRMKEAA